MSFEIVAFAVFSIVVSGFSTAIVPDSSCADALHALRTEQRLRVESKQHVDATQVAYTLYGGPFRADKSAYLLCEVILEEVGTGGGGGGGEF